MITNLKTPAQPKAVTKLLIRENITLKVEYNNQKFMYYHLKDDFVVEKRPLHRVEIDNILHYGAFHFLNIKYLDL